MNKKLFLSILSVVVLSSIGTMTYAKEIDTPDKSPKTDISQKHHPYKHFKGHRPSKEEMEAKKAEFEKRLQLTEEQKKQIENNKQKDREKMKPLMEGIMAKKGEIRKINHDLSLSKEEKEVKTKQLREEIQKLRIQADALRKQNMQEFENLLTDEQKLEFAKIKAEQQKKMEERRKNFKGKKGFKGAQPPIGLPVQPKPIPVEK